MALKPYRTLLKAASDEFIVNKSRFIGYGQPLRDRGGGAGLPFGHPCPAQGREPQLLRLHHRPEHGRDALQRRRRAGRHRGHAHH